MFVGLLNDHYEMGPKPKKTKSPGFDETRPALLVELSAVLIKHLKILFECSVINAELPGDLKQALISAVFKSGKKADPVNYRPISLNSIVCRIIDSFITYETV